MIPLSHQHQRSLALCVRIDRAQPIPEKNLDAWQAEIDQLFRREIDFHFAAEESAIFPVALGFGELIALVEELRVEHAELRGCFSEAAARSLSVERMVAFGGKLSAHIRKEERQLFERLQQLLTAGQLAELGVKLEAALGEAGKSCLLTSEATRVKARR
ncbi:MAG: hemerythrin domain-containing protein [Candidatus Sulfotelmatobacter sp.]